VDLIVAECDVQTVLPVWRQLDSALPFLRQPTPTWACRVLPQIRISYGRTLLKSMKCTSVHLAASDEVGNEAYPRQRFQCSLVVLLSSCRKKFQALHQLCITITKHLVFWVTTVAGSPIDSADFV